MNTSICATCNVCEDLLPTQTRERVLAIEPEDRHFSILVIDDAPDEAVAGSSDPLALIFYWLETWEFAYTTAVRCEGAYGKDLEEIVSHCAVWTNMVAEDRKLILSTKRGLAQLKVGADKEEGDAFRSTRLGVVLCIPPLLGMGEVDRRIFKEKTKRVMREAGLLR